jgi:serine/threonine protein kinase
VAELDNVRLKKGDVVSRRYEIEEVLGSGLLGVTYKARHITSEKSLAIKVLKPALVANPRDRKRFEEGFKRAKEIRHEGLVRYGEIGEHDGLLYFVQEYFPSQSLRELLNEYFNERKSFSFKEASQIILKVLRITDTLHNKQLIHRNLKPENVLIHTRPAGPGGSQIVRDVKVTDVGFSELVNPTIFAESYVNRTEARYLAPELSGFDAQAEPASDIYSIGVMYYELLVGQTPRGTYLSPSQMRGDLPEYVDNIIEVAIGVEAEDRYPSAPDMINDIMRVFEGEVFDDAPTSNFRNILIGVGVGAVLAGGIALYLTQDPPDNPMVDWKVEDQEQRDQAAATIDANAAPPEDAPSEMLYIPSGEFVMGMLRQETGTASSGGSRAKPSTVALPAFYIDRYKYPNHTGKEVANTFEYAQATEACTALGKELCTALQWEKACRGQASLIYPYGDTYNPQTCGSSNKSEHLIEVSHLKDCVSTYGVRGMGAGAAEWTQTVAKQSKKENETFFVLKGSGGDEIWGSRCAYEDTRRDTLPVSISDQISLRCCKWVE